MNSGHDAATKGVRFAPQAVREGSAYQVRTGRRALSTPGGAALAMPTEALALRVAEEWRVAGPTVRPTVLRLGRLAAAATDAARERGHIEDTVVAYAGTDLLCYWSDDAAPQELRARQAAAWQPMLDWATTTYGVRLRVTRGIAPVAQDEDTVARLRTAVRALDTGELVALRLATAASGSLIVALGLVAGAWDAGHAAAASSIDERFQMERWGNDAEAEAVIASRGADLADAGEFLALSRPKDSVGA